MIEPLLQAERLLMMGLLDQAEAIYRRTVERDPRNAIAYMGLARVGVERGDMASAHAQATMALRIDPENAAATAMVARTSELLGVDPAPAVAAPEPARKGLLRRLIGR